MKNNQGVGMEWPLTFKCNNKCISCILDLRHTKNMGDSTMPQLKRVIENAPANNILSFTGGEPTLRENLFEILKYARKKHPKKFMFLVTNARRFSDENFTKKLYSLKLKNFRVGTALYSHNPEIHDLITQAKESWSETVKGIKNLLKYNFKVEIRIILQKANYKDLEKTALFIAENFPNAERIVFINMKYTGNAFINRKKIFVRYSKTTPFAEKAAEILEKKGFEVRLFHFPLCLLKKENRHFAEGTTKQSSELTLLKKCEYCVLKEKCPQIWKTYLPIAGESEFKPVLIEQKIF